MNLYTRLYTCNSEGFFIVSRGRRAAWPEATVELTSALRASMYPSMYPVPAAAAGGGVAGRDRGDRGALTCTRSCTHSAMGFPGAREGAPCG